jgi:hypothetical protein
LELKEYLWWRWMVAEGLKSMMTREERLDGVYIEEYFLNV